MNRILLGLGQIAFLAAGLGFLVTSVVFMSIVYQVIPNYSVNGKPVAIIVGPVINTQVGIVLFAFAIVCLGLFVYLRKKAKRE